MTMFRQALKSLVYVVRCLYGNRIANKLKGPTLLLLLSTQSGTAGEDTQKHANNM